MQSTSSEPNLSLPERPTLGGLPGAAPPRARSRPWSALPLSKTLTLLLGGFVLRLSLLPKAFDGWQSLAALAWGGLADLGLALFFSVPALSSRRRWLIWAQRLFSFLFWGAWAFWLCIQFFYFDEFGTRLDYVVLDYIFYTGEVTGNVFESYPVAAFIAACAFFALGRVALSARRSTGRGASCCHRLCLAGVGTSLFAASLWVTPPFDDRTTRELARSGAESLTRAALTGELSYASHYSTMADPLGRLRAFLSEEAGFAGFTGSGLSRRIETGRPERRHNVVLVLAESLGRELTAEALGAEASLSPRLDALMKEGLLYERFYATGTRTARALEGAIASFPPIPGNAIVRLRHQRPLDTLARVLDRRGYRTAFAYGGDLGFDNMASFLEMAGFSEAIADAGRDRPGAFSTAWGAADEFVFGRSMEELRGARQSGKPLFLTVLTVSNHRPFLFPEGRVEGVQGKRAGAARYADEALGRFFGALKREGFQEDTLVAVVGDHGPRSYTRERMPADAHRVPFFVWGPAASVTPGARSQVIGSTMDVAPTLLGLLGGSYEAAFFGRDLARVQDGGLAPMQDKQDVGLRLPEGMVVLGFNGRDTWARLDDSDKVTERAPMVAPPARELAISLFQSAAEFYESAVQEAPSPSVALGSRQQASEQKNHQ